HPIPVVMVSTLTEAGRETTLRALELGAVDFITKPKIDVQKGMSDVAQDLIDKVKAAAVANVKREASGVRRELNSLPSPAPSTSSCSAGSAMLKTTDTIIAIGSSTGGTEAVREILMALPANTPPILITQHMPPRFTKTWADRLNSLCRLSVKEAVDGDSVLPGHALVAPGGYHMVLTRNGARYMVRINQDPPVNRHRPSVDVLFESVATYAGRNSIGVILTGMGGDGAKGLLAMKQAGARTIAQDEATCVVFGMPKEAIKVGGVDKVLPLSDIAGAVVELVGRS
ncbi:MAG: chemotaxis response regulator protein-glutamate methylesterase, partial [Nitrospira sp.]|nr:chemotaxis response regulator protein-glutamate methylesterase [Nitrospira sp.]